MAQPSEEGHFPQNTWLEKKKLCRIKYFSCVEKNYYLLYNLYWKYLSESIKIVLHVFREWHNHNEFSNNEQFSVCAYIKLMITLHKKERWRKDGPNKADVHTWKWEPLTADGSPAEFFMTSAPPWISCELVSGIRGQPFLGLSHHS